MPLSSVLQLISILILLVIVIVMAYFASKWVAGYQKTTGSHANIEVIESCRVAPAKYLAIVRVGGKYLAVGIGKDEITFLTEIDRDELVTRTGGETGAGSFQEFLERIKNRKGNRGSD